MRAQAYVNRGLWVADCPADDGGALAIKPRQAIFACPQCRVVMPLEWPRDAVWLWDALLERPNPQSRNWAPAGHRQAMATNHPDGQSVADLVAETREHLEAA